MSSLPVSRRGFLAAVSLLPGIRHLDTHWFARDEDEYLECRPWPDPVGIMKPIKVTDEELIDGDSLVTGPCFYFGAIVDDVNNGIYKVTRDTNDPK